MNVNCQSPVPTSRESKLKKKKKEKKKEMSHCAFNNLNNVHSRNGFDT